MSTLDDKLRALHDSLDECDGYYTTKHRDPDCQTMKILRAAAELGAAEAFEAAATVCEVRPDAPREEAPYRHFAGLIRALAASKRSASGGGE